MNIIELTIIGLTIFNQEKRNPQDSSFCSGKLDKDSMKHGVWICTRNGKVIKREKFKHGRSKGYIKFNEKGDIIETQSKNGIIKKRNDCGC